MRVFVYRNLHKDQWSVKALSGANKGRVVAHALSVQLHNTEFKVSEAGRERVRREGVKNVHAGVVGDLIGLGARTFRYGDVQTTRLRDDLSGVVSLPGATGVTYNPYLYDTFVVRETEEKISNAYLTLLDENGKVYVFEDVSYRRIA